MKTALATKTPGTDAHMRTTGDLGKAYFYFNQDSCLKYIERAASLAKQLGDTAFVCEYGFIQARIQMQAGQLEPAKEELLGLLELGQGQLLTQTVVNSRLTLSEIFALQGDVNRATEQLDLATARLQADDALDPGRKKVMMGSVLMQYGVAWNTVGNVERTAHYMLEAIKTIEGAGAPEMEAHCYSNLGSLYSSQDPQRAEAYLKQGLALNRKTGNAFGMYDDLTNLAAVLEENGKVEEAQQALDEAIQRAHEIGADPRTFSILGVQGRLAMRAGNTDEAIAKMTESYELVRESESLDQVKSASYQLYNMHEQVGNYAEAFRYLAIHKAASDSIRKSENVSALAALDVKREYDLKALQDSLEYQQRTALFESQSKVERRTRYGLMGGVLMLGVFGFVLFNRYRVTQRQKVQIEESAAKIQAAEAQRTRFFANISHEFRTPLSVINGMGELIQSNPDKWAQKGGKLITNNGKNLLDLVNQILNLQKLENQELSVTYVQSDVHAFLKQSASLFEPLAIQKGLDLHVDIDDPPLQMDFDREKLLRMVTNLMGNAIKFTETGRVALRASQHARNGHPHLQLEVSDTGIGIAPADIENIFGRFYQVETAQAQAGQGTGIGLNYVHELVQLLGGDMDVESTLGQGSTFRIWLPISNNALPLENPDEHYVNVAMQGPALSSESSEGPELLIIEDNPDIIQLLLGHLSGSYRIRVAENGIDGLAVVQEHIPDLVLSDVMMPGKDGFEVLDTLKNDERTSHIPVVMLTAKSDVESRLQGLRRGADDYIAKPFHGEELRLRLQNALVSRNRLVERYAEGLPETPSEEPDFQLEDAFLLRVQEVLHANLDNSDFGIPDFCRELGVSRTQLHNKLKALSGKSTSIFIRDLRLEKAHALLADASLNVSEVCYQTGFSSHTYFTRVYTEKYGKTPSASR